MNKFYKNILLMIIALPASALAQKKIDLDTFVYQRTQHYPLANIDKIIVYTPPRTGSTLIYNVARLFFERTENLNQSGFVRFWKDFDQNNNLVIKSHARPPLEIMRNKKNVIIFALRNPIDTCFSYIRMHWKNNLAEVPDQFINRMITQEMRYWYWLESLIKNTHNLLVLRYEAFAHDIPFLCDQIEKTLNLSIAQADKDLAAQALNKDNIVSNISEYPAFGYHHEQTGLHGNHIENGIVTQTEKQIVMNKIATKLLQYHADIIARYHYSWIFEKNVQ